MQLRCGKFMSYEYLMYSNWASNFNLLPFVECYENYGYDFASQGLVRQTFAEECFTAMYFEY